MTRIDIKSNENERKRTKLKGFGVDFWQHLGRVWKLRACRVMCYDMLLLGSVAIIASQTLPVAAELRLPGDKAPAVKRAPLAANAEELHLPGDIQLSKSFQKNPSGWPGSSATPAGGSRRTEPAPSSILDSYHVHVKDKNYFIYTIYFNVGGIKVSVPLFPSIS